jgi:hypothetical protein
MTDFEQHILDTVRGIIGAERLDQSIVYLSYQPVRAGTQMQVGDVSMNVPWAAHLVFIDLEPGLNWGHECLYVAIGPRAGQALEVHGRIPPFLKPGPLTFRALWRGTGAPEWAVEGDSE